MATQVRVTIDRAQTSTLFHSNSKDKEREVSIKNFSLKVLNKQNKTGQRGILLKTTVKLKAKDFIRKVG